MKLHQLFVRKNTDNPYVDDSYFYILEKNAHAVAFDPGLFAAIDEKLTSCELKLDAILNTHHHPDHVKGNLELQRKYGCPIYASLYDQKRIQGDTRPLNPGDTLELLGSEIKVLDLKAHTLGLIGFYIEELSALFPGDAIFSAGCGRLFEGTASDLLKSMQVIASLPEDTLIYCSHEYTLQNLTFALTIDKNNKALDDYYVETRERTKAQTPSVPSRLSLEKQINPYLRVLNPSFLNDFAETDPVKATAKIRQLKDNFKG